MSRTYMNYRDLNYMNYYENFPILPLKYNKHKMVLLLLKFLIDKSLNPPTHPHL